MIQPVVVKYVTLKDSFLTCLKNMKQGSFQELLIAVEKEELDKGDFKFIPMAGLADFSACNKRESASRPEGENQLYDSW
jgi:hypothetical protein